MVSNMKKISIATLIEFLIIVSLLGAVLLVNLPKPKFHPDESMWINQSSHLEDFFKGNFATFDKQKFYALTMPTVTEYVIGLSRRAGGYRPADLNEAWDWNKTFDENKATAMPNQGLLWWSRLLPALLGIASILITFYLVKRAFNARVGYLWIILTIINPWLTVCLQRAMGESPLLFCITMSMLVGILAIQSFDNQSFRQSIFWMSMFGLFTGLAGQTKSNGLAMLIPGIIILILLTFRGAPNMRWRFFLIGLTGLCLTTFIAFVGTNPFLWSDPIGRTLQTLQYRVEIMKGMQAQAFPNIVIHNTSEAIQSFISRTFANLTALKFPNSQYLQIILASFGLIILSAKAWTALIGKTANYTALSIFLAGSLLSIPSLFTPLDIDRYYFFPVYFVSMLVAVGFDWFLRYLMSIPSNSPIATETSAQPEA